MIPAQQLVAHFLDLYGHETAHLTRDQQMDLALQLAQEFNRVAGEILAERMAEGS